MHEWKTKLDLVARMSGERALFIQPNAYHEQTETLHIDTVRLGDISVVMACLTPDKRVYADRTYIGSRSDGFGGYRLVHFLLQQMEPELAGAIIEGAHIKFSPDARYQVCREVFNALVEKAPQSKKAGGDARERYLTVVREVASLLTAAL